MLGRDLTAQLESSHQVFPLTRADADISDGRQVAEAIDQHHPDIVIHAAAFTAVDECERQPEVAFRVNSEGTRNVALACRRVSVPMLYISTDYVFDGQKASPYLEGDEPNPLNVYGWSKLKGEKHLRESLERFWIVRTSWLYGPFGKNFVDTILAKARQGESLRVVNDQVGTPTYTLDLCVKLETIIVGGSPGIYHATNQGFCSWFEFAQEILRQAGLCHVSLSPIPTSASDRPARRPGNSCLANSELEQQGLGVLPPWQDALRRYLLRRIGR